MSDVVMYWKETPVRGVEDAELPQFSILGHKTNDRKVILQSYLINSDGIIHNKINNGLIS